ncbi:transcriptional regulatory protein [Pseudooceanicola batsensis HTCC2597]|uniref:Transcriptional regulatory protein n=1 Tax=Pseudooceanicola batsensis (strain ATCC BAA-863 / DSM 15984 / KCTC 12145 / HTCC2597) TaxID=252305 RepID=A3TUQ9_PSEBH|nr:MarR family transcriptional regulator [Pseudooceanicola batsensis]EAQ04255.1 transcriptional regulatory protein [Pseudooceanicola batsensis HTCC2597]
MTQDRITTRSASLPGHLIRRLHQRSTRVFADRMREAGYDLTPVQFVALDALRENAGIDQAGLAQAIAKDRATVGAVLDRLEQKGLIERAVSRRDKRARELALTDAGRAMVDRLDPLVQALQADILPGLTAKEYAEFVRLAAKAAPLDGPDG